MAPLILSLERLLKEEMKWVGFRAIEHRTTNQKHDAMVLVFRFKPKMRPVFAPRNLCCSRCVRSNDQCTYSKRRWHQPGQHLHRQRSYPWQNNGDAVHVREDLFHSTSGWIVERRMLPFKRYLPQLVEPDTRVYFGNNVCGLPQRNKCCSDISSGNLSVDIALSELSSSCVGRLGASRNEAVIFTMERQLLASLEA